MSSKAKQLSKVDDESKLTVFGYIRRNENILRRTSNVNLFQNVPLLITSLCTFYYHIFEQFEIAGKGVKISDDKKSITVRAC